MMKSSVYPTYLRILNSLLLSIVLSFGSFFLVSPLSSSIGKAIPIKVFNTKFCKDMGIAIESNVSCIKMQNTVFTLDKAGLKQLLTQPHTIITSLKDEQKATKSFDDTNYLPIVSFSIIPVLEGDRCTVSGLTLDPITDVALEHKGRRFPFKKEALEIFLNNPGKQFGTKEVKGALFVEDAKSKGKMNLSFFYVGAYIMLGFIFGGISSSIALKKNLSPLHWFIFGFVLNIIAFITIMAKKTKGKANPVGFLGRIPKTKEPVSCAACGYENHPDTILCSKCSASL